MTYDEFLILIRTNNFPDPILVEQPANGCLDTHSHPFEVRAFVIEGSIEIEIDGIRSIYHKDDAFHLLLNQSHKESYGFSGVKYYASRKFFT
jgi:hypothetical protein